MTGVFELASTQMADRIGGILDQEIPTGEGVVITRRVLASGRSSVSVNGSPVTATMLREAGQYLVDIHGQHDQQFLLKSANQMLILDSFAGSTEKRQEFAIVLGSLRAAQHRLAELRQSEEKRRDQLDLYQFQLQEIDSAAPQAGEYAQARSRYAMLKNLEQLRQQTGQGAGRPVRRGRLRRGPPERSGPPAGRSFANGRGACATAEQLQQARGAVDDVARELARYQDRLEVDPGELGRVEERLDQLNALIHKYARSAAPADDPLSAVLEHRRGLAMKIEQLQSDAQALGTLDRDIEKLRAQLQTVGSALTRTRAAAAKRLKKLVEEQFHELEMHEATFDVSLRNRELDDPGVDSSGLDEIDFMVRTNPGQETLPLRKIASGGEISRIMLALKTILADKDQITVLVFDEIDANIGDRLGATIGRKMRAPGPAATARARRCRQERRLTRSSASRTFRKSPPARIGTCASPRTWSARRRTARPSRPFACWTARSG